MKKSRHQKIIDLVQHTRIATQEELADILAKPELRANGKYIISPEK